MKRQTLIAIAAGALAVVLLWYFALYKPKGDDLTKANAELTQAERQNQDLQATLARLRALAQNRPQLEAALRRLAAAVPDNPDLASFILAANQIAVQSGVDWLSIAPTPPAAGTTGGPSVVAMSIQIQGGFFQVLDYLNRLEKLERLVIIDTINIAAGAEASSSAAATAGTSSTGAPTLSVTLSARMFTRSAAASGASGASGGTTGGTTGGTPSATTSTTTTPATPGGTSSRIS